MVTTRQLIANSIWSSVSFVIHFGIGMLLTFVLPHLLGKEEYGRYGYYFRIFAWTSSLSILFVPPAILRYGSELRGIGGVYCNKLLFKGYKYQLFISIFVTLCTLIYLCLFKFNDKNYLIASIIILACGFTSSFAIVGRSFLEANQKFRLISRLTLWSAIFKLLTLVVLFIVGSKEASWFLTILLVENFVLLLLTFIVIKSEVSYSSSVIVQPAEWLRDFTARIKDYSLTTGVSGLFSLVTWGYIEVVLIKLLYTKKDVLSELSYYCLAVSITTLMVRVVSNVNKPLLTFFVHHKVSGREDILEKGFMKSLLVFTMTGGAGCVFLYMFSNELFLYVFPVEMMKAREPFVIMLIPSMLLCMCLALGPLQQACELHKMLLWVNVISAILNLVLDVFLIPKYGAVGAAMVNCIIQSLSVLFSVAYQHFVEKTKLPFVSFAKLAVIFVILVIMTNIMKQHVHFILVLIGALLLYPALLFFLRLLSFEKSHCRLIINY